MSWIPNDMDLFVDGHPSLHESVLALRNYLVFCEYTLTSTWSPSTLNVAHDDASIYRSTSNGKITNVFSYTKRLKPYSENTVKVRDVLDNVLHDVKLKPCDCHLHLLADSDRGTETHKRTYDLDCGKLSLFRPTLHLL